MELYIVIVLVAVVAGIAAAIVMRGRRHPEQTATHEAEPRRDREDLRP
jgi:Tfp pilus assembly protein FimT